DLKLIVMESLKEYEDDKKLVGWIRSDAVKNQEKLIEENNKLFKENSKLKESLVKTKTQLKEDETINGYKYQELKEALSKIMIDFSNNKEKPNHSSLLKCFIKLSDSFNVGIQNSMQSKETEIFLFYNVVPQLQTFGLMEKVKVAGVKYQRYQTSKDGLKFQAMYRIEQQNKQEPVKD
ncbi:DUF4062 domain-containing protein, partial [Paenibacillus terrae]